MKAIRVSTSFSSISAIYEGISGTTTPSVVEALQFRDLDPYTDPSRDRAVHNFVPCLCERARLQPATPRRASGSRWPSRSGGN